MCHSRCWSLSETFGASSRAIISFCSSYPAPSGFCVPPSLAGFDGGAMHINVGNDHHPGLPDNLTDVPGEVIRTNVSIDSVTAAENVGGSFGLRYQWLCSRRRVQRYLKDECNRVALLRCFQVPEAEHFSFVLGRTSTQAQFYPHRSPSGTPTSQRTLRIPSTHRSCAHVSPGCRLQHWHLEPGLP